MPKSKPADSAGIQSDSPHAEKHPTAASVVRTDRPGAELGGQLDGPGAHAAAQAPGMYAAEALVDASWFRESQGPPLSPSSEGTFEEDSVEEEEEAGPSGAEGIGSTGFWSRPWLPFLARAPWLPFLAKEEKLTEHKGPKGRKSREDEE